jgi:hypothetical protein
VGGSSSHPLVTLTLKRPCQFGTKVTFMALSRFLPFSTNPIVDELIEKVDAARRPQSTSRLRRS